MAQRNRLAVDARSLLACIPLFAGLRAEHLDRLGTSCRLVELPGHRSLYAAGQAIREIHYLISGTVKRFSMRADNLEKVLELVEAGHPVGLAEALCADSHLSFAETLDRCSVVAIGRDALRAVLADDVKLANRVLEIIARQQHAAEFAVIRHHSLPVTQRVLDYLLSLAGEGRRLAGETTVRLGASKRLIAASLDMAPETFSRTLRQLTDDGIIVVDGRNVHVQHAALAMLESLPVSSSLPPVRYPRQERGAEPELPSAVEVINLCGRHRMLSQRMTTSWVLARRGIGRSAARVAMRRFGEDFQRNLARTASLALPPVVRDCLPPLQEEWREFSALLANDAGTESPEVVFERSERILALADRLTVAAVTAAGTEAARCLELAARNRMLCSRITKLWLFLDWPVAADRAPELVRASVAEFQCNLERLQAMEPRVPQAAAQLAVDAAHWRRFLEQIEDKRAGRAAEVFAYGEELLRHVDTTVKLYERLAERQPA
jgi:CRP-like cAMP-binding protein